MSENSCKSENVVSELEHSKSDATTYNHAGIPIKIYPLELQEINPNNDIVAFLDRLYNTSAPDVQTTILNMAIKSLFYYRKRHAWVVFSD